MHVFWDARAAAAAIADLPTSGPLPCRTVVVQNPRLAHVLRRELAMLGRGRALAGTLFVTVTEAAQGVLQAAGTSFTSDEDALRPTRLAASFRGTQTLAYFDPAALADAPGWEDAFARTLAELEAGGLRPAGLRAAGEEPQWRDVAAVWEALDAAAGPSWTLARTVAEAGTVLRARPALWPFDGPSLVLLFPDVTAGEVRLTRAIPRSSLGLFAARPYRTQHMARLAALLNEEGSKALELRAPNQLLDTERDILAHFLFESPEELGAGERQRSERLDGTVHLEEHAGVEAEVEAAVEWVGRQILEHGTPLDEIAILAPRLDPLAALISERLARLPWQDGPLPTYVAGGLPISDTAAGARALAVVRALRAHLAAEALANVLPVLRLPEDAPVRHLGRDRAIGLAYSLGTVGGDAGNPRGALEWAERARAREATLRARIAAHGDGAEQARARREAEHRLVDVQAIRPALEALVALSERVLQGLGLADVGAAVADFLDAWLLAPGSGAPVGSLLRAAVVRLTAGGVGAHASGEAALQMIEETLRALRRSQGVFGAPAVYIGALQSARGLRFDAVRIVGLAEGHCPSLPREDVVLPDGLAVRLRGRGLRVAKDKSLAQLHALDLAVRGARREVVLSFSRVDVSRSSREPASIYLEAAAALGRPGPDGSRTAIPDGRRLRRDCFGPAREAARAFADSSPLLAATWLTRVAGGGAAPPAWATAAHLDLEQVRALRETATWGALDGLLGQGAASVAMPGLDAERPISASGLRKLLECPHRFLLDAVMQWREPTAAPPTREIDRMAYGTLFHAMVEAFAKQHGAAFDARAEAIDTWLTHANRVVEARFDEFLETYPLIGTAVRQQQRKRLRDDLHRFLRAEWRQTPPRQLIAAEHPFGYGAPATLGSADRPVHVRGFIDRIDREGDYLLVRDLKTGKPKPRRGKDRTPTASIDLQIALYGLVAETLATERGLRVGVAYVYTGRVRDRERAFREDFDVLQHAANEWLDVASALLAARDFPRTPVADDCTFCAFRPVCGPGANDRAAALLASTEVPHLVAFRRMKKPDAP